MYVVVEDHDDRDVALFLEAGDHVEDRCPLLGAHRRQRLVQQQDIGVAGDRPRDSDRLALTPRQARDWDVQAWDVDPDLVERSAGLAAHQHVVEKRDWLEHTLPAQEQVVVDRQLVDQRQILVDGVDPVSAGVVDALWRIRLALEPHRPGVLLVKAADDLDERRLAGAVVAQQPQNLALAEMEVDVAQGRDRAKALGDVLDAQDVVGRRGRPEDRLAGGLA